ncbi:hypothetical protein RQ832_32010, partial [Roseomonas sp. DSM 102946]|nr:hypothetical protein [Roseomonas sp. DSM 102946]
RYWQSRLAFSVIDNDNHNRLTVVGLRRAGAPLVAAFQPSAWATASQAIVEKEKHMLNPVCLRSGTATMSRRRTLGLLTSGLAVAAMRPAWAAPKMKQVEVAPALYELAFSPSRNALFVLSAGGFAEGAPASRLLRLDPQSLAIRSELTLPLRGFGVALDD